MPLTIWICSFLERACASRLRGPSHVLKALGCLDDDTAVLRFSLSRFTTADELEAAALAVAAAVVEVAPPARKSAGGGGAAATAKRHRAS